jgi:hypothetical protein
METLDIQKFDPTVEELNKLVANSKKVVVTDIDDRGQLETVKKTRIELKSTRVAITKKGKELREEALAFQKAVIAKEKELVAIIEPEEDRLQAIETEVKEKQLKRERELLLPSRKEELAKIGDGIEVSDEELLEMNTDQFTAYKNQRIADKNDADRQALEAEQARIQAEKDAMEREKEAREREAQARKDAEAEAERRLEAERKAHELRIAQEKEEAEKRVIAERERMEREQKEKEELEAKEKAEAERLAKEEQDKLEKQKKYQAWLKANNYDEKTDKIINGESEITLYRTVSTFKK